MKVDKINSIDIQQTQQIENTPILKTSLSTAVQMKNLTNTKEISIWDSYDKDTVMQHQLKSITDYYKSEKYLTSRIQESINQNWENLVTPSILHCVQHIASAYSSPLMLNFVSDSSILNHDKIFSSSLDRREITAIQNSANLLKTS